MSDSYKPCISIILPTFNEEANIERLLLRLENCLKPIGITWEYVIIDDNSRDNTVGIVETLLPQIPHIRLLQRRKQASLAGSVLDGINAAEGYTLIVMDSDFNHQPEDVPKLLSLSGDGIAVLGSRYIKGGGMSGSQIRYWGSWLVNRLIRFIAGINVTDCLSGFFCAPRKSVMKFANNDYFHGFGDYYIYLLMCLHKEGLSFKEMPTRYGLRVGGVSKIRYIEYLRKLTITAFRVRKFSNSYVNNQRIF